MSEKRAGKAAPVAEEPAAIRNVVLVGPSGSGKTTLMQSLLIAAGAVPRTGPLPADQPRSVGLDVATVAFGGAVITLIDTPGYADFLGDVRAGLRGADGALFVVSSVDGVDPGTQLLWNECEAVGMPRAIVVTKLDKERADFDETVAITHRVFVGGGGVLPLHLPVHADNGTVAGFIDVLSTTIHEWTSGAPVERAADAEHIALTETARNDLIEGIITESEDESLMDAFIGGETIATDTLVKDLERAVARGHFHPVLGHAAQPAPVGAELILDLIARGFPSPLEHPLPVATGIDGSPKAPLASDPAGPLCAEVIKTTSDPYVGKLSIVRVFSGTLKLDEKVHVSGHFSAGSGHIDHDIDERVGALSVFTGAESAPVSAAIAGSIVSVAKLTRAETGDTLSNAADPLLMEPWLMPEALLPVAIKAHASTDEDKLSQALGRLLAEDPTLRLEHSEETGQIVLWTMGEAHADLVVDHLRTRYGVTTDAEEVRIGLRETFSAKAEATGRLVKQSGGHGQYAVCNIVVEPLPMGSGFEFVDAVVGGAVPRQFIPSVEKGVRHQMARGVAAGYPVTDIKVTLTDGKAHSVDSSDMAFQTAGALALKDAANKVPINLLEPIMRIEVTVPDEFVGAVLSDVSGRRGQVLGTESADGGNTLVTAMVPEVELTRYAIDIRSISHGSAQYHREPAGYQAMPAARARTILGGTKD